ncbi:MAG TPA: adenylate/guanylate cyclase domain-containing protein [Spirochaetota bacterium]|nr:adenylate/guanylate cyclase domain-containing protein [Spirochaetota bacterium]HOM38673.1 adenylate/guanylate cyclase domain-containing protein [Spirochaetota bacterium]HPQ49811.1 adenylate/guanylate cyclase domain-containing protein [Spirochaetota bacterium]
MNILKNIIGEKFEGKRIFPVSTKIIIVFALFTLVSNLSSNYINLFFNRSILLKKERKFMIKELKEIYNFCNDQYQIYEYKKDIEEVKKNIEEKSKKEFRYNNSIAFGVNKDASFFFLASNNYRENVFSDKKSLKIMLDGLSKNITEGFINISFAGREYLTIYKYNPKWDIFIVKGEEAAEFYKETEDIFKTISMIIFIITIITAIVGIMILRKILRYLGIITKEIIEMNKTQELKIIDLKKAPLDDISFLGISFNSLASTINNLINIFKKFTNRDIVIKAYKEKRVRLEGSQKELTCLFSDIKGFTYMTETLGSDIINLLNIHYDRAIKEIIKRDGVIGSIIGDALLAVFGVLESSGNKSYLAIESGYKIQEVARLLRVKMSEKRDSILKERGYITEEEEKIFKAVAIEVGVGIDGGIVFYGNIGSTERMTNTVIGDNVNSASRLEGLTRIYKIPIICSEYIKSDVENNVENHGYKFVEIDTVQVKGKTIGKKIYWPLKSEEAFKFSDDISNLYNGLNYYYNGEFDKALKYFKNMSLDIKDVFIERIEFLKQNVPSDWNGIWKMETK